MKFLETLINGCSIGGIYAMIALGYTMVYGIAKMLNFAHGDIIMVGAYVIILFLPINPIVSIIAAIVLCAALGITIEKIAYKPLRKAASPIAVLITAIGVSYLLQGLAQLIYGSRSRPITLGKFGTVTLFNVSINISSLLTLGLCVVIMVALTLFIKKTKVGCAMLAVSEDRAAAKLMGININGIITLTFAIGSALAAFASTFYLIQIPSITPTLGSMPGIKAFTAAVIGGIGSIPGAMIGGILLGVIEKFSMSIPALAEYTNAIEFGLLILILLLKPTGLLGKKRREKV